jgi:hypothetical protein
VQKSRTGRERRVEEPTTVVVGLGDRGRTDPHRVVREADVPGASVRVGVHGDRAQAELARTAQHATGDLAAVRDEQRGGHRPPRAGAGARHASPSDRTGPA